MNRNSEARAPAPSPSPRAAGWAAPAGLSLPQLLLIDEAILVFIQDVEYLLHVIRALFLQSDHLEELFVVEGVDSCWGVERGGENEGRQGAWGRVGECGCHSILIASAGPVLWDGRGTPPREG